MLSAACTADINGRAITEDEAPGAAMHLTGAGLDTVSPMLGLVMIFLAENPEHRRALVDDPQLISRAANEISRPLPTVTMVRQVRMDIDYLGVHMRKGDRFALPGSFSNLDPEVNEDPLALDFPRRVKQVLTFGNGVHRCPDAAQGLAELVIVSAPT